MVLWLTAVLHKVLFPGLSGDDSGVRFRGFFGYFKEQSELSFGATVESWTFPVGISRTYV